MSAGTSRSRSSSKSSSGNSAMAQRLELKEIDNLELFAAKALTYIPDLPDPMIPEYHVLDPARGADMLSWSVGRSKHEKLHVQIQDIGDGLARVGAIGDGNCMVHSMFTATSPTYRAQTMEVRQEIADRFRDILSARIEELSTIAEIIYVEQGGAIAFSDSFENLVEGGAGRSEIDMELGPVIGQLYGFNYLAVSLDARLNMLPVRQTLLGRRPDLPTVLIHYIGGALEGGEGVNASQFSGHGHYEVVIKPVVAGGAAAGRTSSSRRATTAKRTSGVLPASGAITLNEVATTFMFTEAELASVLAKFGNLNATANMSPTTKGVFLRSVARKREEDIPLSPATLRTLAALEKKALGAKKSSSPKRSTRKSSSTKPVGGAGAPTATRRSTRTTTLKKTTSSSSSKKGSGVSVSSETLAAIQALGAKKTSSPRRSTRTTTLKKTTSSHGSRSVSPSTLAAIAAMEAASLKGKSK
jgi:hypothetical protein